MTRLVQLVAMIVTGVMCAAGAASAQTAGERFYAEGTVSAAFGNTSSGAFGGEAGYWITDMFGAFFEGGRVQNVATSEVEDKAAIIADHLSTTADVKQSLNYFAAGVVARLPIAMGRFTPMALVGFGGSQVDTTTEFGSDLGGQVQLGGDLDGRYRKAYFTFGFGARTTVKGPWFGDISYRYGTVGKNDEFELKRINTSRLQFGFGRRF